MTDQPHDRPHSSEGWTPPPPGYPSSPPTSPPPPGAWQQAPWQGAPAPAPIQQPTGGGRSPWKLVAVIGLAGVLGLAGLVVSRYTDETEADDDRAASDRAEGDDELGGGDDDVRVIDVDAPTGPVVQNSSYTLTLPGGWVGTDMSDGVAGVGAEVFPADPQAAAAVDAVLSLSGISDDAPLIPELLAVDASIADAAQSRFGLMLALGVPAEFGTDTPEEATEEFVQGMLDSPGARGEPSAEVVDLDGRRVGRVVALEGEIGGAGSVSYLFVEELLILNFTVQETTAAQLALLDASAATLSAR